MAKAKTKVVDKLTDEQYIAAHLAYSKDIRGHWEVAFKCADGYQYMVGTMEAKRTTKSKITDQLFDIVLNQRAHKIQP